jgi:hypothetical protein
MLSNSTSYFNLIALIVPVLLTAIFTYLYSVKKEKYFRFLEGLDSSLDAIICPIYHDLLKIKKLQNADGYESAIKNFFEEYSLPESKIHKLGDYFTLRRFYEATELFDVFQLKREEENWRKFNYKFDTLCDIIKNLYFDSFTVLYKDFYWYRKTHTTNIFIKFYYEVIKFIYELMLFVIITLLFFYYFIAFSLLTKSIDISFIYPYKELILIYSAIIFSFFGLAVMLNSPYLSSLSMQSRDGVIRKLILKIFPKFIEFWDEFPTFEYKKYKNFPKMLGKRYRRRLTMHSHSGVRVRQVAWRTLGRATHLRRRRALLGRRALGSDSEAS